MIQPLQHVCNIAGAAVLPSAASNALKAIIGLAQAILMRVGLPRRSPLVRVGLQFSHGGQRQPKARHAAGRTDALTLWGRP